MPQLMPLPVCFVFLLSVGVMYLLLCSVWWTVEQSGVPSFALSDHSQEMKFDEWLKSYK